MMDVPAPRSFTSQDGLRIAYRRWGADQAPSGRHTVLCLSGTTRSSRDFTRLAESMCDDRPVIAMDWRGCGVSGRGRDWTDYQPQKLIQDVMALAVVANLHRIVVIGTSLGGAVGMALHVIRPGLIGGLALNDIGPEIGTSGIGRIWDVIGRDHPQPDWDAAVAWCHAHFPPLNLTEEEWQIMARHTFVPGDDGLLHVSWDTTLADAQRRMSKTKTDLWPYFRATKRLPVMLVRGELSDVLSSETAERMKTIHPDLDETVVKGCGHAPNLSAPDILEKLHEFLERCDASLR